MINEAVHWGQDICEITKSCFLYMLLHVQETAQIDNLLN